MIEFVVVEVILGLVFVEMIVYMCSYKFMGWVLDWDGCIIGEFVCLLFIGVFERVDY